jgi:hypothetical protein
MHWCLFCHIPFCSIQLREAQKECDEVKQLYIEVCSSKEKLIAALECEQKAKKDLTKLLDEGTEQFKKIQTELGAEKQKVCVPAEELGILSLFKGRN